MESYIFSLGCGDCSACPYRIKCSEYSDYLQFMQQGLEGADERT